MEFIFHCMAVTKIMIPLDFSKFSRRKVTKGVYRAFFFFFYFFRYVEHSGYLPWAESNNLIVLFPQTEKTDIPYNPQACFEWWSFSPNGVPLPIEKDVFATKKGLQMSTLFNLIEAVKNSSFSF